MKSNPMKFLNDNEFYRWMALCDKAGVKSEQLLREISLFFPKREVQKGGEKFLRAAIVDYTNRNLTFEDFEKYVNRTRSVGKAKELLHPVSDAERYIVKESYDYAKKKKVDVVKFENVDEAIFQNKKIVSTVDKVDKENNVDEKIREKYEMFKKLIGGNMKEESR